MLAAPGHPAAQADLLADVAGTQGAAEPGAQGGGAARRHARPLPSSSRAPIPRGGWRRPGRRHVPATRAAATSCTARSSATVRCSPPVRSGRTVTVPPASSSGPTMRATARPRAVGQLHLGLHATARRRPGRPRSPARRSAATRSRAVSPPATSTTKASGAGGSAGSTPSCVAGEEHPLDPDAEADARGGRAAQHLDQAVVAAAAADGVLGGVDGPRGELEGGPGVVVEPPHQAVVEHVGRPRAPRAPAAPGRSGRRRGRRAGRRAAARRRWPRGRPRACSRGPAAGWRRAAGGARRTAGRGARTAPSGAARRRPAGRRRRPWS